MRRLVWLCLLCLLLCGCEAPEAAPPEAAAHPYTVYCGEWTAELGDGSLVWHIREDGTVMVPAQQVDDYRSIGGMGSWDGGEDALTVTLDRALTLIPVTEDGYMKLHCPLLNQTLVRPHQRQAAREAKFVDVTLTDENLWEYFALQQVPAPVDENGERLWKEVFVMGSPVYEDGLIYWSERDVRLELVYWTTYELQADKAPYGVSFYVDTFNSAHGAGTLTFVKADHVAEYHCDGSSRKVLLKDGTHTETIFTDFRYDHYPY